MVCALQHSFTSPISNSVDFDAYNFFLYPNTVVYIFFLANTYLAYLPKIVGLAPHPAGLPEGVQGEVLSQPALHPHCTAHLVPGRPLSSLHCQRQPRFFPAATEDDS